MPTLIEKDIIAVGAAVRRGIVETNSGAMVAGMEIEGRAPTGRSCPVCAV